MRWDLITQQKSSVVPLNQYRARLGIRSCLMYLCAPKEIVAAAFNWRQEKHGISMTHSFFRWLGSFFLSNGYFLILIKSHLHPLRGLLKADLEEFSLFLLLLGCHVMQYCFHAGHSGWEPTLALVQLNLDLLSFFRDENRLRSALTAAS